MRLIVFWVPGLTVNREPANLEPLCGWSQLDREVELALSLTPIPCYFIGMREGGDPFMKTILYFLLIAFAWFALNKWILPRFGIKT